MRWRSQLKRSHGAKPAALSALALAVLLAGCSSSSLFSDERVDYRTKSAKINPLEVPPDLTQLSGDSRYQQQQQRVVTASAMPAGGPATAVRTASPSSVAPGTLNDVKIERDEHRRWINIGKPPEQVWPQIVSFWQDLGFTLVKNDASAGVMETNWAENRAKLPQDIIRQTLGSVLDSAYSTGELDQYRTRVERTPTGSEIFITHKGMEEVHISPQQDGTRWQPRPPDPQMENEMLARLLVKLGASQTVARNAVENPVTVSPPQPRARIVEGKPSTIEIDDGLDRAWRRVGVALDRSGFTVEDRDRAAGLYFVRYVDPKTAGMDVTTGFFTKLFSGGKTDTSGAAVKYQVALKSDGTKTTVSVLDSQGAPDNSDNSKRIVSLLVNELK